MAEWKKLAVDGESVEYEWPSINHSTGGWAIVSSWPRMGRQGPEVVLHVLYHPPGRDEIDVAPARRLSLHSSSGQDSLLRTVRAFVKDNDGRWTDTQDPYLHNGTDVVTRAISDLQSVYEQTGTPQAINLNLVKRDRSNAWMMRPIWPGSGATALVAGGNSGKSFMAQAIGISLAAGVSLLQRNTSQPAVKKVLYLDFESDEATFVDRFHALVAGFGGLDEEQVVANLPYMQVGGQRLSDIVGKVAKYVAEHEVGGVIIDSMSASVGDGLIDDSVVNAYWDAVARLRVPSLVVVHKSAESVARKRARAFGSIMTENRLRMAWNLEKMQEDAIKLTCFKDNNTGQYGAELAYLHETDADQDHLHATRSSFLGVDPASVLPDVDDGGDNRRTRLDEICEYLAGIPETQTPAEIADAMGLSVGTVKSVIHRNRHLFGQDQYGKYNLK